MTTENPKPNLPVYEIRISSVHAAIWEQVTEKGTFYNVTYARTYRDQHGQWKNIHSYREHDIPALVECANDAEQWMRQHRQALAKAA